MKKLGSALLIAATIAVVGAAAPASAASATAGSTVVQPSYMWPIIL